MHTAPVGVCPSGYAVVQALQDRSRWISDLDNGQATRLKPPCFQRKQDVPTVLLSKDANVLTACGGAQVPGSKIDRLCGIGDIHQYIPTRALLMQGILPLHGIQAFTHFEDIDLGKFHEAPVSDKSQRRESRGRQCKRGFQISRPWRVWRLGQF